MRRLLQIARYEDIIYIHCKLPLLNKSSTVSQYTVYVKQINDMWYEAGKGKEIIRFAQNIPFKEVYSLEKILSTVASITE